MAYVAYDQNKQQDENSTNVLDNSNQGSSTSTAQTPTSQQSSATYVSNGNPYGNYGTPSTSGGGTSTQSIRKANTGASSGTQTNVQSYIEKNQKSSEDLGKATSNQLQTTADIAKKNLESVQNKFQQGMQAGGLENSETAVQEAQGAFNQAANQQAAQREYKSNEARLYDPTGSQQTLQNAGDEVSGIFGLAPSAEDQALINANKARVIYGDDSYKDFDTAAAANEEIAAYNKQNPGYYTYGKEQDLGVTNDRLSKILNAEYQGPNELSEIAGYGKAYNKFQDAAQFQNQVLKGGNNTQLLDKTFATPQNEYSYGAKLLDDLLLGQGKANEMLKSTAQNLGSGPSGKILEDFTTGTKEARTQAGAKKQELDTVKQEARKALMDTAAGRSAEVNTRINDVIQDWDKYPQHFKDRFTEELNQHNVSSEKHNQYAQAAQKYGSYENAIAQKQAIQQTVPDLESFDINNLSTLYKQMTGEVGSNGFATGMMGGTPLTDEERVATTEQFNKLYKTFEGLVQGGNYTPETIFQALITPPSGIGRSRSQHEQIIRDYTAAIPQRINEIKNQIGTIDQDLSAMDQVKDYKDYDPNALNVKLSQLESEALGVQGGEGLYNLLKDVGVEGLFKTAKADRNKLISEDEQSQLARLQNIAQLAKDYGVKGSGVNFTNQYSDRDAAGQQNALSALDTDNLTRMLQGGERTFRNDAAASNILGSGYGTGSSSGLFGSKKAQAWKTLSQNFGDLIQKAGGYRNMYSNEGVNKDLLRQASESAKGVGFGQDLGAVDGGIAGGVLDVLGMPNQMGLDALNKLGLDKTGIGQVGLFFNPLTAPFAVGSVLNNALGGSKAAAQGEADTNAYYDALAKLQQGVTNKVNTSGFKNQLTVNQNTQQDAELFKLLGMLDTTNL